MDIINIVIEEDGTVSFKTDEISDVNHVSADEFLAEVTKALGGERNTVKRKQHYNRRHTHTHTHTHAHH